MKALLVIAHGSRNPDSNEEIRLLVDSLRAKTHPFDLITHAFLELIEPGIADKVDEIAGMGYLEITVLPLFLARGNHVARDVPAIIEQSKSKHDGLQITVTSHIGAASTMPDLILEHLNAI